MPTSESVISYESIQKIYGDGQEAVKAIEHIDLDIGDSEFISVVGPSGCGKSTLLRLTSGLETPSRGSVTVNGINVTDERHKKHDIGLIFQNSVLLEWRNVRENIMLPIEIMSENGVLEGDKESYLKQTDELIELVGLAGFEDSYPNELSGGMQQRVSICRSLIYDPPVLLMDEPFGALDALTRDRMNQELLDIWSQTDKTVIFVTHNLEEAVFLSDRVIVLSERPATVLDELKVDLPRPRGADTRRSSEFQSCVSKAESHFHLKQ